MGIDDEMTFLILGSRAPNARYCARSAHSELSSTVTLLEAWERDENRHEVGDGHCRRNDIIIFGIARASATAQEVRTASLRALLPC